jgi:hypothetical protein
MCVKAGNMPNEADRHVYLYCKNHYRINDYVTDLKKIYGKRNAVDPEHIRDGDLIEMLLKLVYYHMHTQRQFVDFTMSILEVPTNDAYRAMIKACVVQLTFTNVQDIPFYLGEPDETVLPVSKPHRKAESIPDGY